MPAFWLLGWVNSIAQMQPSWLHVLIAWHVLPYAAQGMSISQDFHMVYV